MSKPLGDRKRLTLRLSRTTADQLEATAKARGQPLNTYVVELLSSTDVPPKPDNTFARVLLDAAAKSGDPGAIRLAMQLGGVAPCEKCMFVHYHCQCVAQAAKRAN